MNKNIKKIGAVIASALVVTSLTVTGFAASKTAAKKTEVPTGKVSAEKATVMASETAKVVIALGPEFANKYFALETDAGMESHAYKADKNGTVEFLVEQGGSSKYALTPIAESATTTEDAEAAQNTEEKAEDTTVAADEKEATTKKSSVKNTIIFVFGIALAGTYLVLSKVLPKRKGAVAQQANNNNVNNGGNDNYDDDEEM